jgi:hypothetical protein
MKNIKRYMYILFLLSLFISFVFTFLFYNATQKVEKISTENIELFNPRNTKISYNYNIEKIETIENKLFIKGWLLEKGKNNAYINRIIVVKDNKNDYYKLFTKSNDREDINDYFGRKYDYNNVGLIAKGKLRKDMEYPLKIYFLIKEKNKSILVDTNQIIEKNQGIQKISIENFEILNLPKENVLFPYTIETTKIIDDKLFIEGWLLKKGENNNFIYKTIVIEDSKNNYYKLNARDNLRLDVDEAFNEEYDYSKAGIIVEEKLKNNMEYPFKIYFLIKEENRNILIDTGQKIERKKNDKKDNK